MRRLRATTVALVGLLAVLGSATAAAAAPYPAEEAQIKVSNATVPVGSEVTVQGSGYLPFERVSITVMSGGQAGRTTELAVADANGGFVTQLTLDRPGVATIVATGPDSRQTTSTTVIVLPKGATPSPGGGGGRGPGGEAEAGLPVTGSDGGLLVRQVALGSLTLLAGVLLVGLAMRRRRRVTVRD